MFIFRLKKWCIMLVHAVLSMDSGIYVRLRGKRFTEKATDEQNLNR